MTTEAEIRWDDTDQAPGAVAWCAEKDRFGNAVTLIRVASGRVLRMVHHTPSGLARQRATIYRGRGVFVRMTTFAPENPCMATSIIVAGYAVSWGDGDNLGVENNSNGPDLGASLQKIDGDDFEAVLLIVLDAILNEDTVWERKELLAAPEAPQIIAPWSPSKKTLSAPNIRS